MYSVQPCRVDPPRVSRYWIPGGALGIEATVLYMRWLVRSALGDPLLDGTVRAIVSDAGPHNAAAHIRRFLERTTRFVEDPPGVELIRTPAFMLEKVECEGYAEGDCDDVAVLGAALGLSAGLPARFVLYAFEGGALYEHVFTELMTPAGAVELDTTRPAQMPPGIVVARQATRRV